MLCGALLTPVPQLDDLNVVRPFEVERFVGAEFCRESSVAADALQPVPRDGEHALSSRKRIYRLPVGRRSGHIVCRNIGIYAGSNQSEQTAFFGCHRLNRRQVMGACRGIC